MSLLRYQEVEGDLIKLAQAGKFDVIAHGCNCFNTQGSGLAPQMKAAFGTDKYQLERATHFGDYNKLGQIEANGFGNLIVVNCYTQYEPGKNLDYEALRLCLRKLNRMFKGKHIGLPQIGCGIAGGDWKTVKYLHIQAELKDCYKTVVIYKP